MTVIRNRNAPYCCYRCAGSDFVLETKQMSMDVTCQKCWLKLTNIGIEEAYGHTNPQVIMSGSDMPTSDCVIRINSIPLGKFKEAADVLLEKAPSEEIWLQGLPYETKRSFSMFHGFDLKERLERLGVDVALLKIRRPNGV